MEKGHRMLEQVRARAARKRCSLFREFIGAAPRPLRVIDLGGSQVMWRRWLFSDEDRVHVTLVNSHAGDTSHLDEEAAGSFFVEWRHDVRQLTASDLAPFDIVFSNSLLEHLYSRDEQRAVADTVMASGKPYFVQVPNRRCLVDPHFPHPLAPFYAGWPRSVQAVALAHHRLGSGAKSGSVAAARARLRDYVPIDRATLQHLFPDSRVVTDWSLGLPMSLVARRGFPS